MAIRREREVDDVAEDVQLAIMQAAADEPDEDKRRRLLRIADSPLLTRHLARRAIRANAPEATRDWQGFADFIIRLLENETIKALIDALIKLLLAGVG